MNVQSCCERGKKEFENHTVWPCFFFFDDVDGHGAVIFLMQ